MKPQTIWAALAAVLAAGTLAACASKKETPSYSAPQYPQTGTYTAPPK